jgi:hypothetical protein
VVGRGRTKMRKVDEKIIEKQKILGSHPSLDPAEILK